MIVQLAEAVFWFVLLGLIVLRLDRLWLRLRSLKLDVPGWVKASARFFNDEPRNSSFSPKAMKSDGPLWLWGSYGMASHVRVMPADEFDIDIMVITHPDQDHLYGIWRVLKGSHHGRGRR